MKVSLLSVLSLSLLLFHARFSLGGKSGKGSSDKKTTSSSHGKTQTSTTTDSRNNQGSVSEGGYPKQQGPPGQGGNAPGGGGYGHGGYEGGYGGHDGYGHGGYGGGYGGYGHGGYGHGGYGRGGYGHGGYGRGGYKPDDGAYGGSDFGSYGGGYINRNRILSPHYGNSFGYGSRGGRGSSPFYQKVKAMGISPSDKSKGFGRTAAWAASGGVAAKMAVDYGLGRFPRPHFQFQSPEEEYYYNHYMYTTYGVKSTDANDYRRDYSYSQPLENYERHMNTCMKTVKLLLEKKQQKSNKPALNATSTSSLLVPNNDTDNNTAADNSSSPTPPNHPSQTEAWPLSPTSQIPSEAATTAAPDQDDDTVSIMEIGYPALIKIMKVRKCLKSYMVNSEKYLKVIGGAQRMEIGFQMVLALVTSTLLMIMNSNMLQ